MKTKLNHSTMSLALMAGLLGSAVWSPDSQACAAEPYVGAVCIMATAANYGNFGNGTYVPAQGQLLLAQQYQALYSIVGATFGGDGRTNFNLPNLSGRVAIGSGTTPGTTQNYRTGQYGGGASASFTLNANQAPVHTHTINALTVKGVTVTATSGNMVANTTLTGLTATTSLNGVTASAAGSGLTINASNGGTLGRNPSNATLATPTGPTLSIYSDAAPSVAMKAGSISGTLPVTFNGNPTTTISGTPATALSGAPMVTIGGSTDPNGGGAVAPVTVPTLPPYLAMNYYVAINGLYPVRD